jgi:hypothetical protein
MDPIPAKASIAINPRSHTCAPAGRVPAPPEFSLDAPLAQQPGVDDMYQWDYEREIALQIALDYLERTGQAPEFVRAQSAVASAWQARLRHRIALANAAIKAVEREKQPTD